MSNDQDSMVKNIWSLETHGDPLGKVRDLIAGIWMESGLVGMLVTMIEVNQVSTYPRYITNAELLNKVNPFQPLMESNIARLIPELLENHPDAMIGAVLRPCEMRAWMEMAIHAKIKVDRLHTICVDCLGTFPKEEYQWRLERIEKSNSDLEIISNSSADKLASEALKFARQGGIVPYRYRSACQICISPEAQHSDFNIHILGLPVRQRILLTMKDPAIAKHIHLIPLTESEADEDLLLQHERVVSKKVEQYQRTLERVNQSLGERLPANVDAVIHQLENCDDCQKCMDVCPICSVDRPTRYSDGHLDRSDVVRWLVSCAGCGMCEQSCTKHLPLSAIFAHIRKQLDEEGEYVSDRSIDEHIQIK